MEIASVKERFRTLDSKISPEDYNYDHFRLPLLADQLKRTFARSGLEPGEMAPDFKLPRAGGGTLRLSDLSGAPVLLRFGSPTCPVTIGTVESFSELYSKWGDRVQFVEVVIRQAHPGHRVPAHTTDEQKEEEAFSYKVENGLPWAVAADDVEGTTHQVYGTLAAPVYLIDSEGRVAWYSLWSNARVVDHAIETLLDRGGVGVVEPGVSRSADVKAVITQGWPGIRRGLPQSLVDLETATPGVGMLLWAGYQARKLMGSAGRLSLASRTAFGIGAAAIAIGVALAVRRR